MYKKLTIIITLLAFSSVFAFGQNGRGNEIPENKPSEYVNLLTGNGDETVKIKKETLINFAKYYLTGIEEDDAIAVLKYTNPFFYKKFSSPNETLDYIEKDLENLRQISNVDSITLADENLLRKSKEPFNRMAIKINVSNSDSKEKTQIDGFLIPIPYTDKQEQGVYFLHTEGILTSLTPPDCNISSYQTPTPKDEKPNSGKGSGSGAGVGSGSGSGTGSGSGSGVGDGDGGGSGSKSNSTDKNPPPPVPTKTGETVGIKILSKSAPKYNFLAKLNNVQGTVRLRVTFLSNGTIGGVSAVKGLPCGLTESAIKAARQLKFSPPKRNGKPYSINKVVQYNFSIYGSKYEKFEDMLGDFELQ